MTNSIEEQIRDRISRKSGKEFQQLVWDILICYYPNIQLPKMLRDYGSDGHDFDSKTFFAVYAPEHTYKVDETTHKISNPGTKNIGDYEKFSNTWIATKRFSKWVFITKENLTGKPLLKIAELNNNGDGVRKENMGLDNLVKLSLDLKQTDRDRIYNLASSNKINIENLNGNLYSAEKILINSDTNFNKPGEVETIMDLIDYISNNNELKESDFDNVIPDPDKKIYTRFKDYCKAIESEIQNYPFHVNALKAAEGSVGLDQIRVAKVRGYLKQMSRRFLRECGNDPIKALDKFTDYLEKTLMRSNKHNAYDHGAIRYYLISEIPKCNMFPNEDE